MLLSDFAKYAGVLVPYCCQLADAPGFVSSVCTRKGLLSRQKSVDEIPVAIEIAHVLIEFMLDEKILIRLNQ